MRSDHYGLQREEAHRDHALIPVEAGIALDPRLRGRLGHHASAGQRRIPLGGRKTPKGPKPFLRKCGIQQMAKYPGIVQGAVSPAKRQANPVPALVYVAQALGGGLWAKMMALALALSVIATTGTGIVLTALIVYGMASYRVAVGARVARLSPRIAISPVWAAR